jgi:hypothetical protein
MKRRLLGGIAALILVLAGLFGSATAPAQAMTLPAGVAVHPYVALGDSFAAGYGLPAKGDPASVACSRSNLSYPGVAQRLQVAEEAHLRRLQRRVHR